jgi:hypothetical protein
MIATWVFEFADMSNFLGRASLPQRRGALRKAHSRRGGGRRRARTAQARRRRIAQGLRPFGVIDLHLRQSSAKQFVAKRTSKGRLGTYLGTVAVRRRKPPDRINTLCVEEP